jgi:hypothetical protein
MTVFPGLLRPSSRLFSASKTNQWGLSRSGWHPLGSGISTFVAPDLAVEWSAARVSRPIALSSAGLGVAAIAA